MRKKSKSRTPAGEGPGDGKGGPLLTKMPEIGATPLLPGVPVAGVHPLPAEHRKEASAPERRCSERRNVRRSMVSLPNKGAMSTKAGFPPRLQP